MKRRPPHFGAAFFVGLEAFDRYPVRVMAALPRRRGTALPQCRGLADETAHDGRGSGRATGGPPGRPPAPEVAALENRKIIFVACGDDFGGVYEIPQVVMFCPGAQISSPNGGTNGKSSFQQAALTIFRYFSFEPRLQAQCLKRVLRI